MVLGIIVFPQNVEKNVSIYIIYEMLYILTFQVESMFSPKFIVLFRFSHFWEANSMLFLDQDK